MRSERVLILGGSGLLGHNLCRVLSERMETWATFRDSVFTYQRFNLLPLERAFGWVDAQYTEYIRDLVVKFGISNVINAIGIVKQKDEGRLMVSSLQVNTVFPHILEQLCTSLGVRLIHLSTDCVFSGARGSYMETDAPDPIDAYGRTKFFGEVTGPNALTLRTSMVGWEIGGFRSLLSWFARQRGKRIDGYAGAIYSGLASRSLADLVADIVTKFPGLTGLYHVASEPITKYKLLTGMRDALGWHDITIEPNSDFFCDRSLCPEKFEAATGWRAPGWEEMIGDLAASWPEYEGYYG